HQKVPSSAANATNGSASRVRRDAAARVVGGSDAASPRSADAERVATGNLYAPVRDERNRIAARIVAACSSWPRTRSRRTGAALTRSSTGRSFQRCATHRERSGCPCERASAAPDRATVQKLRALGYIE